VNTLWVALAFLFARQPASYIDGLVIDALTRQPVAGASVLLARSDALTNCNVVKTDERGKFAFTDLPAGSYQVRIERDNYLPFEYAVEIKEHRTSKNGGMPMLTPEAVISGRITDQEGEPASRVFVRAYAGEKLVAEVRTNDLGDYRLFGLAPGAYVITAERYPGPSIQSSTQLGSRTLPGPSLITPTPPCPDCPGEGRGIQGLSSLLSTGAFIDPRALSKERYPTVFYPGTTDRSAATPIKVAAGARVEAIDLTLVVSR